MTNKLPPLTKAGPGQDIEEARGDLMALLSDDAKALVLGELLDMRQAAQRAGSDVLLRWTASAIRRVARGLYRYELRRVDQRATTDFDPTTGRAAL